ncbi:hypothetical protein BC939DRAFT_500746 [Gamsiella multidivaricata]|uniref:uncharacterized protein n=1 Tax=Gamsiella multidivaricata TaxID=101098 RepID=UPI00221F69E7|nr:uncharacterized protein BC939DRAFT_500746 [Gamsiella multidivaricata]KAG0367227.1 hypothetical protein BGZ54_004219 [Gamsiella multidivaricata]KAI7828641.1 hypothetical protein BC939DRAFT_500746 [Gamsiella multidivaricata]
MSYRGGHGRGGPGGMQQKPRGGGGPGGMNFPNDMSQQQFGYQQRGFPPMMMQQQQPGQPMQQPQPQQMNMNMPMPQQIQIPQNQQGSRSFMSGMPSPSLTQPGSMGYQGTGSGPNTTRLPFGPPIGPIDQSQKSHHDILRKHQEEYALKQSTQMAITQAHSSTPGTYIGMPSKHNNTIIAVLPRLPNPQ